MTMIAITGATGQLGRLVIKQLLSVRPARQLVAVVRDPAKAADLATKGVQVRKADYEDPVALNTALTGVDQLLLISSSEIGRRSAQHRNVIAAAKHQGLRRIVYTSLLHADKSPLNLATEHLETEAALRDSGIRHLILRNGWYTENYTASVPAALAHKAFYGSAGQGRISSATRADYAEAAAKALLTDSQGILELAGDESYTLADLAAEISRQSGQHIPYIDIPEAAYREALEKAGLPDFLAALLAHSDTAAGQGALYDTSRELSKLIGRPTTPLAKAVEAALKK